MADNLTSVDATGTTVTLATDEISLVHHPRYKLVHGANGANDGDVSRANGFPVTQSQLAGVETLVEKAHGFFTASYQDLTLTNVSTSTHIVYWNDTDGNLYLSFDGTDNHEILPARSWGMIPIKAGATAVHSKYSTDPTAGTCYFGVKK